MTKPRKKYKPKYVANNPLVTFFGGMGTAHAEHLVELQAKNHAALQAIVQGRGDRDSFDQLTGAVNMAFVMSEQGIGPEFRPDFVKAREALIALGKRALKNNHRFVLTGDEMQALNEAMDCHDAQLENVRAIDVDRAAAEVERRLNNRINTTSVKRELDKELQAA